MQLTCIYDNFVCSRMTKLGQDFNGNLRENDQNCRQRAAKSATNKKENQILLETLQNLAKQCQNSLS